MGLNCRSSRRNSGNRLIVAKSGSHGADLVSFNRRTGRLTFWDAKYRGSAAPLQGSSTFSGGALDKAIEQARLAIAASTTLTQAEKQAALRVLNLKQIRYVTVGFGEATNSVANYGP